MTMTGNGYRPAPVSAAEAEQEQDRHERLLRMTHLPATDEMVQRAAALREMVERGADGPVVINGIRWPGVTWAGMLVGAEADLALGRERDVLAALRPAGCWCLGVGGRGTAIIPQIGGHPAEETFEEFCPCPDGAAEQERVRQLRRERMAEAQAARLARHWQETTGIPERFRDLRLEEHPNLKDGGSDGLLARLVAAEYGRASWFLWGSYGVGKTGIAAGYAWRYLHATGESVLFRTLPDLLAELRATYDRPQRDEDGGERESGPTEANVMARYQNAGLLILDDLGAEQVRQTGENTWAADRLYQVIGYRHAQRRPMLFTSNLKMSDVGRRLGERITWRIVEMCTRENIIEVKGANLRAR